MKEKANNPDKIGIGKFWAGTAVLYLLHVIY